MNTPDTDRPIRLHPGVLEAVLAHAREHAPDECCGLLIGRADRIDRAWPSRNELRSPTRFRIDPADHFAAVRFARAHGVEVIGAYHSHPATVPIPSPRDHEEPGGAGFLHLIVSLAAPGGEARLYRFNGRNFEPLAFVTADRDSCG